MSGFDEVNDFLDQQGSAPAAKFAEVGDTVKGEVVGAKKVQQMVFGTKDPAFYPNGDPMWQVAITLRQEDGEEVTVWAKNQQLSAIRTAVEESGGKLEAGGTLAVKLDELKPSEKAGFNPQKIYVAQYRPPAPVAMSASDLI